MAIDFGSRRHGLALSDPLGITAQPLETMTRTSQAEDIDHIRELIQMHEVGRIVIGLPLNMDGTPGALDEEIRNFAGILEEQTGVPVVTWEERLSTAEAERMLISADVSRKKRKRVIDKLAATLILQSYMDANPSILAEIRSQI